MKTDKYSIDKRRGKLKEIRLRLESTQLNGVRELLPDKVIKQICEECEYYFRTRLLTPLVTIFHMIGVAISRDGSFQSAWHNVGETGKTDSLSRARKRLPLKVWKRLNKWVIVETGEEFEEKCCWRGHRLIGIDGTCISMSDEKELADAFGRSGSKHGESRFPIARIVFGFMLNTMVLVGHKTGKYKTGENALFSELMEELLPGDLIVGDRRYAGANLYVEYMRAQLEFITRAHQRLRVESLKIIDVLGNNDYIVEMPIQKEHRKKDPTLPKSIELRVIKTEAKIRGKKESFWLITSLIDKKKYPAEEIKLLYKKRWKVEGLIEEMKIWLGADILRSKTKEGIQKELYARCIAFNLIHWLILKSAKKHQKDADRISVSAAIRLTAAYSLKMSTAPCWMLPSLYKDLLERIACSKVPYRPERIEPRMKKRGVQSYPALKISRAEWRTINVATA